MKRILSVLFIIQICVASFSAILFFRGDGIFSTLHDDFTTVSIHFEESRDNFDYFMETALQHDIHVSRVITFAENESAIVYTTDFTLNGAINLREGRFPEIGTPEFISNIETGDDWQVGLTYNVIPDFHLTISSIENPTNFALDGLYNLHTTDANRIDNLFESIEYRIPLASLLQTMDGEATFLARFLVGFTSVPQMFEFIAVSVLLFICLIATTIQYGITQLKSSATALIHGYDKRTILSKIATRLMKILSLSSIVAYIIVLIYSINQGYSLFLIEISIAFLIAISLLIAFYISITNITVYFYLKRSMMTKIIKGHKSYRFIQACNHGLKIIFTMFFLVSVYFTIDNLATVNERLQAMPYWEKTQDVYRIAVVNQGKMDNREIERQIDERKVNFFDYIVQAHSAFIMHSENIRWLEIGFYPYADMENAPSMELSPRGYRIDISPNFLTFNPITAVNGIDIYEQIIWNNNVRNILVPKHLMPYEDEIVSLHLEDFYFQGINLENMYNDELNRPANETPKSDLSINIIYVENGQYYHSLDPRVGVELGGRILDPIAVIYTGNVDISFLGAMFTSSLYFITSSINAYEEILPMLLEYQLGSTIQHVSPIYDYNAQVVRDLNEMVVSLMTFLIILVISTIAVTYNLIANYFEANKFKLTIKRNFGYNSLKRNQTFVYTFLAYSIPIVVIASLFLGGIVLGIGIGIILIDTIIALAFENRLIKKSFSEIMKGAR